MFHGGHFLFYTKRIFSVNNVCLLAVSVLYGKRMTRNEILLKTLAVEFVLYILEQNCYS